MSNSRAEGARILAQETPPERVADAGPDSGGPRLLIDSERRIVWSNGAAASLFDMPRGAGIERLNLPGPQEAALEAMVGQLPSATDLPEAEPGLPLVHGAQDPVVRADTMRDVHAGHASRRRVTVLEDTGQLVLHAAPETVGDAVEEFFAH